MRERERERKKKEHTKYSILKWTWGEVILLIVIDKREKQKVTKYLNGA